jgi:YD repeat-containing protein
MLKKTAFLITIVLLINNNIFSQLQVNLQSYIPAAPNAAELGKYGSIPVGNVTGIPDISFPLYEIKSGTLSLPITLSYHAAGVQVNQKPSDAGLGWSVNAGGQISRTIYSAKDDGPFGYFNYTPPTYAQLSSITNYYTAATYNIVSGTGYDLEPDLFVYNIGGKSGKFIFTTDKNFMTIPYEPIQITKSNDAGYITFQIVDENGTIYKFFSCSKIISDVNSQQTNINTWHLTSIISANLADTISFVYDTVYFNDQMESNVISIGAIESGCTGSLPSYYYGSALGVGQINKTYNNLNYSELIVKQIVFKNGYIQFNRNNIRKDFYETHKSLDEIVVYNNLNQITKKIGFNYDYFYSPVTDRPADAQYRLKLNSFSNVNPVTSERTEYSFGYDPTTLPPFNTYNMDYWGYYNGSNNISLLPATVVYSDPLSNSISDASFYNSTVTTVGNANREPDATYMQAGILKKITYPTGGYTSFEFEPNKYLSDLSNQGPVKIGGGLRIKSIKNYSIDGALLNEENYTYGENENGIGIKLFDENFFYKNYEEMNYAYYRQVGGSTSFCARDYTLLQRNYFGVSKYNSLNYLGSPVLYSTVTKYVGNTSSNAGKTISHYNILKDNTVLPASFINSGNYGSINNAWNQALQIDEINYKWENNQYIPVSKIGFNWTGYNINTTYGLGLKQTKQFVKLCDCLTDASGPEPSNTTFGQGFFTLYPYPINTGGMRKTAERRISYNSVTGDSIVAQHNYQYANPSNLFITQATVLNSNQDVKITRYKYPQDYSDAISQAMISRNMLTPAIEEKTLVSKNNSETLLSTKYGNYKQVNNLIVRDNMQYSIQNYPLEIRLKYNFYDNYGNILEQQKINDLKEVYLWGYKGQYPVAKIIGSDYATVNGLITQSQIDNAVLSGDASVRALFNTVRTNLNSSSPNAQLTSYTFTPLIGITSQTDPSGRTTYYEYDGFSRLKLIRDQDNNIVKKFCYNYAGQTTSCLESGSGGGTTPATIYAKLSYENMMYGYTDVLADVVVRFYSDAACTQPVSVSNLTVGYVSYTDCNGTSSYGGSIVANGTSAILASYVDIQYQSTQCDPYAGWPCYTYNCSTSFQLDPGNYTIVL